jgi:hypothetical protein
LGRSAEAQISIDRNAILARLELIADSLSLPEQDWGAIAEDEERLIDFAIDMLISTRN